MRALRFDGARALLDPRAPEPAPATGDAVVRPSIVAISSVDLAICRAEGPYGPFTGTLGHEFVGVVERIEGDGATAAQKKLVGVRVVGSIDVVCGKCDMCRSGLSNHCRGRESIGMKGRDGCFADALRLPARNLVAVPDALPDEAAVFAETLASALQAAQQIRVEGKPYITVLGDGAVGLLTAQAMTRLNASVRLVGASDNALAICEKWGIRSRHESETGRRADQDVVVDCTGAPGGLALAMRLVRPRGKIVLKATGAPAGAPADAPDLSLLAENEIEVIGSRSGPISDAVAMLARGDIDTTGLVTRRMKLDQGVEALRVAAAAGQIKVLMEV